MAFHKRSEAVTRGLTAACRLKVGTRVKVYRGGGGTREATIESVQPVSGTARVAWEECGMVQRRIVDAAEIVTLNNITEQPINLFKPGMRVKVYRSGGGTREATIESVQPGSGTARVAWKEGAMVRKTTVEAAELVALNNITEQPINLLKPGMRVTVYRSGGGTREAIIQGIDESVQAVTVMWNEGGNVMEKTVSVSHIFELNNF